MLTETVAPKPANYAYMKLYSPKMLARKEAQKTNFTLNYILVQFFKEFST